MLEKNDPVILRYEKDSALLDINAINIAELDFQITELFILLTNNHVRNLGIDGVDMTESQAIRILDLLIKNQNITFTINLPKHLQNTKVQIDIDNTISNHRLKKNKQSLETISVTTPVAPSRAEGRIFPKRKIVPRIEITLNEQTDTDIESATIDEVTPASALSILPDLPQLERTPLAALVIAEIHSLPKQQEIKTKWDSLTDRDEALEYRKNLLYQCTKDNHPLPELIKRDSELHVLFTKWQNTLNFNKEQYDALLDVYGQYGAPGLKLLFETWTSYDENPDTKTGFLETYDSLLKYMPTYTPFITDKDFQDTIAIIGKQGKAQRSWWMALIKNHGRAQGYSSLPVLFKQFTDTVNTLKEMGLELYEIKAIRVAINLPSALNELIALLTRCPKQDQKAQWECFHNTRNEIRRTLRGNRGS
jgi:hypothetical protein